MGRIRGKRTNRKRRRSGKNTGGRGQIGRGGGVGRIRGKRTNRKRRRSGKE